MRVIAYALAQIQKICYDIRKHVFKKSADNNE